MQLIDSKEENKQNLNLHPNILDILFVHKQAIARRLSDIKGIYFIEHVSINIISSLNEVIVFSGTPSVEYNIIVKELWRYDKSFNPQSLVNGSFVSWQEGYTKSHAQELIKIKETNHNFTYGFNLIRRIDDFTMVYSFATRKHLSNIDEYYLNVCDDLFSLGDYSYKLLKDIYSQYNSNLILPMIDKKNHIIPKKSFLKLIINKR